MHYNPFASVRSWHGSKRKLPLTSYCNVFPHSHAKVSPQRGRIPPFFAD